MGGLPASFALGVVRMIKAKCDLRPCKLTHMVLEEAPSGNPRFVSYVDVHRGRSCVFPMNN